MKIEQLVAAIAVVCLAVLHSVAGQCDSTSVLSQFNGCLSGLIKVTNLQNGDINAADIRRYCTEDSQSETRCAENVINRCRNVNSDTRRVIDKAVNVNVIKGTVEIICNANSTAALEANRDCLARYQPEVTPCLQREYLSHSYRIKSVSSEEEGYEALCEYVEEVKDCQEPYGNCGRDVEMVFDALLHAATPPVCSAVTETASLVLLISLAFVAILKKY